MNIVIVSRATAILCKNKYLKALTKFLLKSERLIVTGKTTVVEEILLERGTINIQLIGFDQLSGFELVTFIETSDVQLPVVEAKPAKFIFAGILPARHVIASWQTNLTDY